MHAVAETHETLFKLAPRVPDGLGVVWVAQLAPFHTSARVRMGPELPRENPTAVHAVDEVHETPLRLACVTPGGLGVGWIAHPDAASAAIALGCFIFS